MADFLFFYSGERRVKETPLSLLLPIKQSNSGRIPAVTPLLERRQPQEELRLLTIHTLV